MSNLVVKAIGIKPTQPLMVLLAEAALDDEYAPYCFCSLNGRLSKEQLINAVEIQFNSLLRSADAEPTKLQGVSNSLIVPLDQALQLHLDQDKEGLAQYLKTKHQTIKVQIQHAILEEMDNQAKLSGDELEAFVEWRDNIIANKDHSIELEEPEDMLNEYNSIYCSLVVAEFCADTWLDWVTKATAIESTENKTGANGSGTDETAKTEKISLNVGDIVFLKTLDGIRKIQITKVFDDAERSHGGKFPTCVTFDELDEFESPIAPNVTWIDDFGYSTHDGQILTQL